MFCWGTFAHAGAATPEKGGAWVAFTYAYTHVQNHLDPNGNEVDVGSINANALTVEGEYGISDRLSVFGGVPYIQRKYNGDHPHTIAEPDGQLETTGADDGTYHGSFQDFWIGSKYVMSAGNWLITPSIAYGHPTHDYEHFAHAAIGTKQKKTDLSIFTGRGLPPPFDRFYLEIDYTYSFVEQYQHVDVNRSTALVEVDYFATDLLMLRLYGLGQKTHGGLNYPTNYPPSDPKLYYHHDQTQRVDFIDVGAGAVYALNALYSVNTGVLTNIWGENGHAIDYEITVGITRAF